MRGTSPTFFQLLEQWDLQPNDEEYSVISTAVGATPLVLKERMVEGWDARASEVHSSSASSSGLQPARGGLAAIWEAPWADLVPASTGQTDKMGKEGRQTKTSLTRLGDIEEAEEGLDTSEHEDDIPGMISKAEDEALQQWFRVYEQVCEAGDGSDSNMENRE